MAALVPSPSLWGLDQRLAGIPEEAECSTSGRQPAAPRRWTPGCDGALHPELGLEQPRVRPLRKCASVPTLHSMSSACGEDDGMEVYVILRPFKVRVCLFDMGQHRRQFSLMRACPPPASMDAAMLHWSASAAAYLCLAASFVCLLPGAGVWRRRVPPPAAPAAQRRARQRHLPLPCCVPPEGWLASAGALSSAVSCKLVGCFISSN